MGVGYTACRVHRDRPHDRVAQHRPAADTNHKHTAKTQSSETNSWGAPGKVSSVQKAPPVSLRKARQREPGQKKSLAKEPGTP